VRTFEVFDGARSAPYESMPDVAVEMVPEEAVL